MAEKNKYPDPENFQIIYSITQWRSPFSQAIRVSLGCALDTLDLFLDPPFRSAYGRECINQQYVMNTKLD